MIGKPSKGQVTSTHGELVGRGVPVSQGPIWDLPELNNASDRAQIGWWLIAFSCLLALLVLVGGATRLTDSGLSITEWKPVTGMLPPLSAGDWQSEFQKYQQIPEYAQVNFGMSLSEFKTIYWWEWGHRFLGRMLGFAFLIPFVYFLVRRKVSKPLFPKLLVMFVLGGAQGALGWFMVKSGLSDRVDVSQYRLAAHLGLAFFIYGYILWVAFDLLLLETKKAEAMRVPLARISLARISLAWGGFILMGLVFGQIVLGGFVAGLHAGLIYNDWPWMNGAFIPQGYFFMTPWYVNFFENLGTVQFNHRMVAYGVTAMTVWLYVRSWRVALSPFAARARHLLFVVVLGQVALGVWVLMAAVPLWLGLLHQAGAIIAFAASIAFCQGLRKMALLPLAQAAR